MPQIKSIVFDLDNTLVDYMRIKKICSYAAANAMSREGLKVPHIGRKLYQMYLKNLESETIFSEFIRKFEGHMDFKALVAAVHEYRMCKYKNMKPYPGVVKTIKELKRKGFKIGVVTDTSVFKAHERLYLIGVLDYVDAVVSSMSMGVKKPDKGPFLKAANWLKSKPSEILFVGDWPEKDVVGAKKTGMKTCFAAYGCMSPSKCDPDGADFVINEVGDLLKLPILK